MSLNVANVQEPGVQADQRLLDRAWLRIGASAVVAAQAMVFSLAINLSEVEEYWVRVVVDGLLIFSAVGPLVFLGGDLVRSAWQAILDRKVTIDLLFLVTLGGALVGSLVSTFTGQGSVYYEVVSILIVVHTAGKMIGAMSRTAALAAASSTKEEFRWAEVANANGEWEKREAASLTAGTRVRVGAGAAISVDGVIEQGAAYVRETAMTGEWRPVAKGPGEAVLAGSYAVDGELYVIVGYGERKIDAILQAVSTARLAPSALQAQADRLMYWFLPLVVGVSLLTGLVWASLGPWEVALFNAMAVLLVACPCAMGLATPVAVWGGLAELAKLGLLARSGDFLDRLAQVTHVCFDKTGTLSEERLAIVEWRWAEGQAHDAVLWKGRIARLQEGLAHPVAQALVREATPAGRLQERTAVAGQGVRGTIDDVALAVGTGALTRGVAPEHFLDVSDKWIQVVANGRWVGAARVAERWRLGMPEVFAALGAQGVSVEVLSGDPRAAEVLPPTVRVTAGVTPEEKAERVRALRRAGEQVLFLGDGVNDATAMSEASVAVGMRGGTELARASALAVFAGDDLRFLPEAIALAQRVRRSIRRNLWFSSCYNLAGMALAATGLLHPVAAALLMFGSSVIVSWQSLRASRRAIKT